MTATHVTILGARPVRHDETPAQAPSAPTTPGSRKDSADLWTDPRGSEPKLGQQGVVLAQMWAPLRRSDTMNQRRDRHSKIEVLGLY